MTAVLFFWFFAPRMCFGACEHQHGTPDQRGADYAETLETCWSSYSPQTAIWTGSGTGSVQIQLQFSSGTRNFRKLQLYLCRSAPKQGPAVRCGKFFFYPPKELHTQFRHFCIQNELVETARASVFCLLAQVSNTAFTKAQSISIFAISTDLYDLRAVELILILVNYIFNIFCICWNVFWAENTVYRCKQRNSILSSIQF